MTTFYVTVTLGDNYLVVKMQASDILSALTEALESPHQLILNSLKDNALEDWDFSDIKITSIWS